VRPCACRRSSAVVIASCLLLLTIGRKKKKKKRRRKGEGKAKRTKSAKRAEAAVLPLFLIFRISWSLTSLLFISKKEGEKRKRGGGEGNRRRRDACARRFDYLSARGDLSCHRQLSLQGRERIGDPGNTSVRRNRPAHAPAAFSLVNMSHIIVHSSCSRPTTGEGGKKRKKREKK